MMLGFMKSTQPTGETRAQRVQASHCWVFAVRRDRLDRIVISRKSTVCYDAERIRVSTASTL